MNDTPYPMLRLTRAQQRYLGLHGSPAKHPEEDPLAAIELAKGLRPFFNSRLDIGGSYQHGPLFGHREGTSLKINHALPAGYGRRTWFDLDERYLLGATDAFQQVRSETDWVGLWLMVPDSLMPNQAEIDDVIEEAKANRLITEEMCLLWVGWEDGALVFRAYVLSEPGGVAVHLDCNMGYRPE